MMLILRHFLGFCFFLLHLKNGQTGQLYIGYVTIQFLFLSYHKINIYCLMQIVDVQLKLLSICKSKIKVIGLLNHHCFPHPTLLLLLLSDPATDTVAPPSQVDTQLHHFSPISTSNCMTWRHQLLAALL